MMTTRQILKFKAWGQEFLVGELLWGDFLLLTEDPAEGYKKIIQELNKQPPRLNTRQVKGLFQALVGGSKMETKANKKVDLEQLLMMEALIMHHFWAQQSSIRNRTMKYVTFLVSTLPVVLGEKSYEDRKYWDKPDKKAIKDLKKSLKS